MYEKEHITKNIFIPIILIRVFIPTHVVLTKEIILFACVCNFLP